MSYERDLEILTFLEKFGIMSRDQLATLVCSDVSNPAKTITRICNRLSMGGYLTTVAQPLGRQYLYGPMPMFIHPSSERMRHHLAIIDLYIELGKPKHFDVEPEEQFQTKITKYRPDIYATIKDTLVCIEVQRTHISNKRMQTKLDGFQRTYMKGLHQAKTLWVCSDKTYNVKLRNGRLMQQVIQGKWWPS